MYCIVALPRTASTYATKLVHSAVYFKNPEVTCAVEPFNPRYNSSKKIEDVYHRLSFSNPLPVIKIISSHDFELARKIISEKKFITLFIEPKNLQKQILKALVCKITDRYFGDRKKDRENFVGRISFTQNQINERILDYKNHMLLQDFCDHHFIDEDIISYPGVIIDTLRLEYINAKYKHVPPFYNDYDMLSDINDFKEKYETGCESILGRII